MSELTPQTVDINEVLEHNPDLRTTISVTSDAISRVYSSIFMARQLVTGREGLPESGVLFAATVRDAVKMIARTYPDFEQFEFEVVQNGETLDYAIVGQNPFTNSILHVIQLTLQAPVIDHVTQDIPKPLPLLEPGISMSDYDDEELDDDYEEDDYIDLSTHDHER